MYRSSGKLYPNGEIHWDKLWPVDAAELKGGKLVLLSSNGTFTYERAEAKMDPACVDSPMTPPAPAKPMFTEDVLVVSKKDAANYWIPDGTTAHVVDKRLPDTLFGGCFRFQAIIDSDGNIFDMKPVATVGSNDIAEIEATLFKSLRYVPTKENVNRTPIKSTFDLAIFAFADERQAQEAAAKCTDKLDKLVQKNPSGGI